MLICICIDIHAIGWQIEQCTESLECIYNVSLLQNFHLNSWQRHTFENHFLALEDSVDPFVWFGFLSELNCLQLVLSWSSYIMNVLQVYFNMLDAFLAEDKIPDEYAGKTQVHHCVHHCSFILTLNFYLIQCFQIYFDRLWMELQAILCNDCEKRGVATFHWLHRKCSYCGSYNTRLLWFCFVVSGNNVFIKLFV
jgi:hypothetical protein